MGKWAKEKKSDPDDFDDILGDLDDIVNKSDIKKAIEEQQSKLQTDKESERDHLGEERIKLEKEIIRTEDDVVNNSNNNIQKVKDENSITLKEKAEEKKKSHLDEIVNEGEISNVKDEEKGSDKNSNMQEVEDEKFIKIEGKNIEETKSDQDDNVNKSEITHFKDEEHSKLD